MRRITLFLNCSVLKSLFSYIINSPDYHLEIPESRRGGFFFFPVAFLTESLCRLWLSVGITHQPRSRLSIRQQEPRKWRVSATHNDLVKILTSPKLFPAGHIVVGHDGSRVWIRTRYRPFGQSDTQLG